MKVQPSPVRKEQLAGGGKGTKERTKPSRRKAQDNVVLQAFFAGRSTVWLACVTGGHKVAGSNPVASNYNAKTFTALLSNYTNACLLH
jgi:hypothetical protein